MEQAPPIRHAGGHEAAGEAPSGVARGLYETASAEGEATGDLPSDIDHENRVTQKRRRNPAYLQNTWYMAGWSTELAETGSLARTIADMPMLFVRAENGEVAVLRDECPLQVLRQDRWEFCRYGPQRDRRRQQFRLQSLCRPIAASCAILSSLKTSGCRFGRADLQLPDRHWCCRRSA